MLLKQADCSRVQSRECRCVQPTAGRHLRGRQKTDCKGSLPARMWMMTARFAGSLQPTQGAHRQAALQAAHSHPLVGEDHLSVGHGDVLKVLDHQVALRKVLQQGTQTTGLTDEQSTGQARCSISTGVPGLHTAQCRSLHINSMAYCSQQVRSRWAASSWPSESINLCSP